MGRQPQTRTVNPIIPLYEYALSHTGENTLPSDPILLSMVVAALLQRVEKRSITEARLLRTDIRIMAGLEKFEKLSPRDLYGIAASLQIHIAYARIDKSEHYPETVQLQWGTLMNYLRENDLGVVRHLPTTYDLEKITKQLSVFPCKCRYRRTIQPGLVSLMKWTDRRNKREDLTAPLAYHLLAALHHTGHENIRKLLSRRSQRGKTAPDLMAWIKKRPGASLDSLATTFEASLPLQTRLHKLVREYLNRSAPRSR